MLDALSDGDDALLSVTRMSESDAEMSLADEEVEGIIYTDDVKLTVAESSVNASILETVLSEYKQYEHALMDIYKGSDLGEWLCSKLLNRNESYEAKEGSTLVTVEQKLQDLYKAIFVTEYTNGVYHTMIGDHRFDSNSKYFVQSLESMLSTYADYEL